jgi:serine/threonine protein kinase
MMDDDERRSEEESSSEEAPPPPPRPKVDYSKNPEKDPDLQELLKEGWVMAPKGAKVQVKNNVPSIFSQKPDVSYLWKNEEPEQEPQYPTQPEHDPFQVDLSKHKITASFEVGPEIARGLFSVVRRGKSKANPSQEVALKVITAGTAPILTAPQRKQLPALLQEACQTPHIVKCLQAVESDDVLVLVLEKMQGELFRLIVKSPNEYTEKDAALVLRQVLEALAFLHSKSLFYGDITPENVLTTHAQGQVADKTVKLAASTLICKLTSDPKSAPPEMYCAAEFKAPEAVSRQPITLASDMWSLGCLAYFALAGYPPFSDRNTAKLQMSIRKGNYQLPDADWKNVSAEAKDFVKKCLTLDPKQRLTAKAALEHPWIKSGGKPNKLPNFKANATKNLH